MFEVISRKHFSHQLKISIGKAKSTRENYNQRKTLLSQFKRP